ncbi:MAG: twin-arginine translocation signal domain-containing protein [Pyrinomonadaceae bacterium]
MNNLLENRRDFLRNAAMAAIALPLFSGCEGVLLAKDTKIDLLERIRKNARERGAEGMGAIEVPRNVSSKTVLSTETDKGEPMVISGRVYQSDGKTPAPNTLIYLYHTDFEGYYGRRPDEPKHGKYRGWMLTDGEGRYSFITIKPAPYPVNRFAAHIHMTVTTEKTREDWIDSILFEGDPLISTQERATAGQRGGYNPILTLRKGDGGMLYGTRDIKLA